MIYPAGTSLPSLRSSSRLLPRTTGSLSSVRSSPLPLYLAASSFAATLATFLPLCRFATRREFSGESCFLIYDRPLHRAPAEARKRKRKGEGWKRGYLLSFISSHFRRSPRYPPEFTTVSNISLRRYLLPRASGYTSGIRRGGSFRGGGREEEGERGKRTFNARCPDSFGVAKFRVCT